MQSLELVEAVELVGRPASPGHGGVRRECAVDLCDMARTRAFPTRDSGTSSSELASLPLGRAKKRERRRGTAGTATGQLLVDCSSLSLLSPPTQLPSAPSPYLPAPSRASKQSLSNQTPPSALPPSTLLHPTMSSFRGATVEDLQLSPALVLATDISISTALRRTSPPLPRDPANHPCSRLRA